MKTTELIIDGDKESADFEYEFECREIWNLGHNLDKIILSGLKKFKEDGNCIDDPEMFKKIDEIIENLEYSIANCFEHIDISECVKDAYTKLGDICGGLWY